MLGTENSQTVRVRGKIKHHDVVLLIDSGSTHNFTDQALVKRLRCQVQVEKKVAVFVANGDKLWTQGMRKGLQWEVQGLYNTLISLSYP